MQAPDLYACLVWLHCQVRRSFFASKANHARACECATYVSFKTCCMPWMRCSFLTAPGALGAPADATWLFASTCLVEANRHLKASKLKTQCVFDLAYLHRLCIFVSTAKRVRQEAVQQTPACIHACLSVRIARQEQSLHFRQTCMCSCITGGAAYNRRVLPCCDHVLSAMHACVAFTAPSALCDAKVAACAPCLHMAVVMYYPALVWLFDQILCIHSWTEERTGWNGVVTRQSMCGRYLSRSARQPEQSQTLLKQKPATTGRQAITSLAERLWCSYTWGWMHMHMSGPDFNAGLWNSQLHHAFATCCRSARRGCARSCLALVLKTSYDTSAYGHVPATHRCPGHTSCLW